MREISAGNRPNNQMSSVGWKNICKDFRRACGHNYNVKAMKNRYTQAKVLATFWKEVQVKSSGLGRGPNGEILASETWWQANTKVTDPVLSQINLFVAYEQVLMTFFSYFRGELSVTKCSRTECPPT